ncbi:MAG: hypothetical protein ABUL62_31850 [Myxococcales bacterium]
MISQREELKIDDFIHRPVLGSVESAERRTHALATARLTQPFRIAVAPCIALDVVRAGKPITLRGGDEVQLTDFVGGNMVASCIQRLVSRDAVIELNDEEVTARTTPKTARYVVARGGSVTTARGLVTEGGEVKADHFEGKQAALDDLVHRGAIVDRFPEPPKA